MVFRLTLAAVVLAALPAAAGAQADPVRTVKVVHDDLNLTTAAGRARFDARVQAAMAKVCGRWEAPAQLSELVAVRKCVRAAQLAVAPQVAAAVRASSAVAMRVSAGTELARR